MKTRIVVFFGLAVMAGWSAIIGYGATINEATPECGGALRGAASWYSSRECTDPTASGERLNDGALTCASWGYPFGTRLRVSHGDKSVVVRVNDRGPARYLYRQGRIIDLTKAAFVRLAPLSRGVIPVTVQEER